jgi:hypothetical protein
MSDPTGSTPDPDRIAELKAELNEPLERLEAVHDDLKRVTRPGSLNAQLKLRIVDMGFPEEVKRRITPEIADLTVRDLNDLASAFAGLEVHNPKVVRLRAEDIRSIDEVFADFKANAVSRLSQDAFAVGEVSVEVSCCCCCPCCCCCCAAADVDPFAAPVAAG